MKYKAILLFSFLILGCDKNNMPNENIETCFEEEEITSSQDDFYVYWQGKQEFGYANAIKINEDWSASPFIRQQQDGNIYLIKFFTYISEDNPDYESELLFFESKLPLTKGCYDVVNEISTEASTQIKSSFVVLDDADAPIDYYLVNESHPKNIFELDSVSLENKYISGKFMVSYNLDTTRGKNEDYNPNNLRLFNGRFEATLLE